MLSYWKDILNFTESVIIGKSSGNIAYYRKLLKIYVKPLKNTCYGINFCEICENQAYNFTEMELLSDVLKTLNLDIETFFREQPLLSNWFGLSDRWVEDGLNVSLLPGPLRRRWNMLTMCNVKTEYKKIVIHKKRN